MGGISLTLQTVELPIQVSRLIYLVCMVIPRLPGEALQLPRAPLPRPLELGISVVLPLIVVLVVTVKQGLGRVDQIPVML